jgi:hypothetical protein
MVDVPFQQINSPPGTYSQVIWLPTDDLVVRYEENPRIGGTELQPWTYRLWKLPATGGDLEHIVLPAAPGDCRQTRFGVGETHKDGRVRVGQACEKGVEERDEGYVLLWDPLLGQTKPLLDYQLPGSTGAVTFHPDLHRGIYTTQMFIRDRMFWLEKTGYRPLDVGMVRANRAAWSPLGDRIIFWGNRELAGPSGPGWAGQPHDLWSMPADCAEWTGGCGYEVEKLVADVQDSGGAYWSPDGQWLAFYGGVQGVDALWLRNMQTGQLIAVSTADHSLWSLSWSPDGQRIAAAARSNAITDVYDMTSVLYVFDVSSIVGDERER